VGFLLALLQSEVFAQRAQNRMLLELSRRPTPDEWRDVVAGALDDPSLRLLDPDGAAAGPGRLRAPVGRDGHTVAVLEADEALGEEPELLRAAAAATLVAVETGQLEGALHESRARAALAGEAERRRFGRDLHDGAQQRLLAIRLRLGELGRDDAVVSELDAELALALQELRALAQGLYPPVLARHGVGAALRAVTRSSGRVAVRDDGLGRHAPACESAIYFCCLEAVQNAIKHAGDGLPVTVTLGTADGFAAFSIADEGAGFDASASTEGAGLSDLRERVAALGGELELATAPGRGTQVRGRVPLF
jgi:signal transduction histidine kinase